MFFLFCYFYLTKKSFNILNLEIILTFSSFIIIFICYLTTIKLIYNLEIDIDIKNSININIFGYQWYWNYFLRNFKNYELIFDSSILKLNEINKFFNYFIQSSDVNNRLLLPIMNNLIFITISDNVIHSWFIPELNIKLETNPGFMNYFSLFVDKIGIYYGNCAEICGFGHSIIPISIEFITYEKFINFYIF